MTHLIDSFINVMFGLCIGAGLTCLFVLLIWMTLALGKACLDIVTNTKAEKKPKWPPYITQGDDDHIREGRHGTG